MASPTNASVVGNAFVRQYYMLLASNPNSLHRFYKEESVFTFSEEDAEKSTDTAVGQKNIHEKILSLDFKDCKPQISFVDSQTSLSGGVVVMVTGYLASKGAAPRRFAQTFFLAPQQNGFYVLNDIFRFLQSDGVSLTPVETTSTATPEPVPSPAPSATPALPAKAQPVQHVSVAPAAPAPPAPAPIPAPAPPAPAPARNSTPVSSAAPPVAADTEVRGQPPIAASSSMDDAAASGGSGGKKTYASILSAAAAASAPERPKEMRPQPAASRPSSSTPQPVPAPAQQVSTMDERSAVDDSAEDEKRSIFVGNLPVADDMTTVESKLRTLFLKYGVITGINLKADKNYGFVDFDTPEAVVKILADRPLPLLDGKELKVEARQSRTARGGSDFRGGRGRGGPHLRGSRGGMDSSSGRPPSSRGGRGGGRGAPRSSPAGERGVSSATRGRGRVSKPEQ